MAQVLDLSKSVYEICTKYPVIKGLMAEKWLCRDYRARPSADHGSFYDHP